MCRIVHNQESCIYKIWRRVPPTKFKTAQTGSDRIASLQGAHLPLHCSELIL